MDDPRAVRTLDWLSRELSRPTRNEDIRPAGPARNVPSFPSVPGDIVASHLPPVLPLAASLGLGVSAAAARTPTAPTLAALAQETMALQLLLQQQQQQHHQHLNPTPLLDPRSLAWLDLAIMNPSSYGPPSYAGGVGAGWSDLSGVAVIPPFLHLPAAQVALPPLLPPNSAVPYLAGAPDRHHHHQQHYQRGVDELLLLLLQQRDPAVRQLAAVLSTLPVPWPPPAVAGTAADLPTRRDDLGDAARPRGEPSWDQWDGSHRRGRAAPPSAAAVAAAANAAPPAESPVKASAPRKAAAPSALTAPAKGGTRWRRRRLSKLGAGSDGSTSPSSSPASFAAVAGKRSSSCAAPSEACRAGKRRRRSTGREGATEADPDRPAPTAAANAGTSGATPALGRAVPMFREFDADQTSRYQCLLREQIEYFEADRVALKAKAQGRNQPIRLGQVGIRCVHCARRRDGADTRSSTGGAGGGCGGNDSVARSKAAAPSGAMNRGAAYYPSSLDHLYQAVQNMANNHFVNRTCPNAPSSLLDEIAEARRLRPKRSGGRGKRYFGASAKLLGVANVSEGSGLVMRPAAAPRGAAAAPGSSSVSSAPDGRTPARRQGPRRRGGCSSV